MPAHADSLHLMGLLSLDARPIRSRRGVDRPRAEAGRSQPEYLFSLGNGAAAAGTARRGAAGLSSTRSGSTRAIGMPPTNAAPCSTSRAGCRTRSAISSYASSCGRTTLATLVMCTACLLEPQKVRGGAGRSTSGRTRSIPAMPRPATISASPCNCSAATKRRCHGSIGPRASAGFRRCAQQQGGRAAATSPVRRSLRDLSTASRRSIPAMSEPTGIWPCCKC